MAITSFAELDSPERLRSLLAERGYFPTAAPADRLFELPPDQAALLRGAQIVALAGPAADDSTLVVLWVPRATLPLDVLRRIRRRLAENTRDGLLVCAQSWQQATLYLLRQEDLPQPGQEPPAVDRLPSWELNFSALRPADRQGLAMLDLRGEDPYDLGKPLLRAFRRATRETIYQNQGLFSNYYLNERLGVDQADAHDQAWRALALAMPALRTQIDAALAAARPSLDLAQTEATLIRPLLAALGWKVAITKTPGQLDLQLDGSTVAFCQLLPGDEPLDVAPLPGAAATASPAPDMQLIGRLAGQKQVLWGILTNGRAWRLISRQATSTSGVFYAVDLQDLLEIGAPDDRDLRWFAAFFGAAWLHAPSGQPGLLDLVYQSGQFWAEKLGNNLKVAIFKDVFVDLANALAEGQRRSGETPDLPTIYRATLVLLYRLLFVLYAESRRLLPLTNAAYYPHSLTYLLSTLALKQNGLLAADSTFSLQTADARLWQALQALFAAIAKGRADWSVPHYNGDLFADDTSPAHELLARLGEVANDYLTKGLDLLARDADARGANNENEALRLIDYRDLDVRRLGSVYEGLLEFQLRRAEADGEVIDGQLAAAVAKRGRRSSGRLVQRGEVYLETTRQDRKASGSYYTPDYIVRYIVEQTVGPVLEQRAQRFGELMADLALARTQLRRVEDKVDNPRYERVAALEDAAIEVLLDLKVLDPAMGSGHFLVAAVNYLSDQIIAVLQPHPKNPLLPKLAQVRAAIRQNLAEQGIDSAIVPDEQLSDRVLLRRMVMKRCIYGVDLNDMAVELAKLSLWLDSFAVGAPLSFLDHHLRWGNSLIGIWDIEKSIVRRLVGSTEPASERWNEFMRALGYMVQVTRLTDSTNAEVQESKALYDQAQKELRPFRERFNVDLAQHFIDMGNARLFAQTQRVARDKPEDREGNHAPELVAKFNAAQQEAEARHFFHWKLEFPEVFIDHEKSDWKADGAAGFDAVVGNPPYGSINERLVKNYIQSRYISAKYQPDYYIVFMEILSELVSHNSYGGLIVSSSYISMHQFEAIRKLILNRSRILELILFKYAVFEDPTVESSLYVVQRRGLGDYATSVNADNKITGMVFEEQSSFPDNPYLRKYVDQNMIYKEHEHDLTIILSDLDSLVNRLQNINVFMKLNELGQIFNGLKPYEAGKGKPRQSTDDVKNRIYDSTHKIDDKYFQYVMGKDIDRYTIEPVGERWIKYGEWLAAPRSFGAFFTPVKILVRQTGDSVIASLDDSQYLHLNNIHNIHVYPKTTDATYILNILNSKVSTYYHQQMVPEVDRVFAEVKIVDLERLPIRRIHFTTAAGERARQAEAARALAAELIADERGLALARRAKGWPRFEAAAYRATPLGQRMAALLPQDAAGAFLAFADGASGAEEHSDVVHDLLASLAEQMIELNKQKQAEVKRLLGWLEAQLEVTPDKQGRSGIDSLPGKTTLQGYLGDYQRDEQAQSWDDVYAVLHKNRKRLVNDHWLSDMMRPQLRAAYEESLARLLPVKQQLARTDALIDQIVYQLYGLTLDEIAVVEGG